MHAACYPMGAGEQQWGSEMRREVSGGPRSECRSPEEGNEVPGDARVLVDQDPEDASLVAQEAQDLARRQRSAAPEDTHAALLPAPLEERGDAWVVRLLRNGAARDPEGGHAAGEELPGSDVRGRNHDALSLGVRFAQEGLARGGPIHRRAGVPPPRPRRLPRPPPPGRATRAAHAGALRLVPFPQNG